MTEPRTRRLVGVLLALALCAGCATAGSSGLQRVALANEQAALSLQRVQLAADQLEAAGAITKAQRDSLSPAILRLAQGGQALTRAIAAADVPGTRAQVIGVLGVLSDLTATVDGLPREARITLIVAIEATRGALLVVSTGT